MFWLPCVWSIIFCFCLWKILCCFSIWVCVCLLFGLGRCKMLNKALWFATIPWIHLSNARSYFHRERESVVVVCRSNLIQSHRALHLSSQCLCVTRPYTKNLQWESIFHPKENYTQRWDKTENFSNISQIIRISFCFCHNICKIVYDFLYMCVFYEISLAVFRASRLRYSTTKQEKKRFKNKFSMSLCINDVVHINLF